MLDLSRVKFYLKISRPIIWFTVLPYYLFPLGGRLDLLSTCRFWLGLLYFTFPVNIMMFGINDMADTDVDKYNPRKSLGRFGGQDSISEFSGLWKVISISNLIPLTIISIATGDWVSYPFFFAMGLGLNIVYNFKPFAFSRKPPLDLLCTPAGFLLEVVFACHLNQVPLPNIGKIRALVFSNAPYRVYRPDSSPLNRLVSLSGPCVFYITSSLTSHLLAELLDLDCDARSGKRTTAVVIGKAYTCAFIGALIFVQLLVSGGCSLAAPPPSKSSPYLLRY
ncbi:hypothetical protein FOZ63_025816 [Perkinsus olseni]|uniref:UbiA prenyltransferase domain-containing protein 1 n=1 Tax=Perkinsus olseni TaxID=32597 RepID=A0A7J6Q3Q9_PEROL|nr:hypothetical protein FOZ63_025816 [Perkinsus olseni]KAF4738087.1 hypothetical protein FOZ62_027961 [Perkinsus olseni]